MLLQSDLCHVFDALARDYETDLKGSPLHQAVRHFQEGVFQQPWAYFALREGAGRWHYLRMHKIDGQRLMLAPHIGDVETLRNALRGARQQFDALDPDSPWPACAAALGVLGFEPGWGATAGRASETMSLLVDILVAPSPAVLEAFLARIPMISRLLIVSPHGYFGQDNVLGRPDTGGQVAYILD